VESDESVRILIADQFLLIVKEFIVEEDCIIFENQALSDELKKIRRDLNSMFSNV